MSWIQQRTGILLMLSLMVLGIIFALPRVGAAAPAQAPSATLRPVVEADTYFASGRPNDLRRGSHESFWVGYDQAGGFLIERSMLRFTIADTALPRGSVIQSAVLKLHLSGWISNEKESSVTVARVLVNNWAENLNWTEHQTLPVDSEHTATTVVGTALTEYQWNLTAMLQKWSNDLNRGNAISLIIKGDERPGQHERGFWSKDCTRAECQNAKPVLEIQFTLPTPTPTNAPTATSTPTPVPVALALSQRVLTATPAVDATAPPSTAPTPVDVRPGDHIVYTITYKVASAVNNAQLTNDLPINVTPIAENNDGVRNGRTITWNLGDLAKAQNGAVSYEVLYNPSTADLRISTNPTPPIIAVNEKIFISAVTSVAPKRYLWDFGVNNPYESATSIQEHTYTSAGIYDFEVTANYTTCTVTRSTTFTVTDNLVAQHSVESSIPASVTSEPLMDLPPDQAALVLPPCGAGELILNEGATITWQGGQVKSNTLFLNPVIVLYMPAISRSP